jgi:hypothetical protein
MTVTHFPKNMRKTYRNILKLAAASLVAATIVPGSAWAASASDPSPIRVGPWEAVTVAQDVGDWQIESYKVSRNLVAWAEISADGKQRQLYAWDGVKSRLLVTVGTSDWAVPTGEEAFYNPATSGYDAADGLVVWVQTDGHDREIYAWDGAKTFKVSDNSYDDRHPVTSRGAVAWTTQPGASYELLYRPASGAVRKLATWQVQNYAFSGDNLYWINRRGDEGFKVYVSIKGAAARVLGDGDDRPIRDYFFTDGTGAVAWEYSTKNWVYDKRVVWHSWNAVMGAYRAFVRDVPPAETRVEAVSGRRLTVNIKDWAYQDLEKRSMLLEENDGLVSSVWRKPDIAKVRYMDGGSVRHREQTTGNSSLVFRADAGGEDFMGIEYVIRDRFEAHGSAAAGARVGTGLVAFAEGKTSVIPTDKEVASLKVRDGDIAWIEGLPGSQKLRFATRPMLVGSAASGPQWTTGFLAKEQGKGTVYLLARGGKRYTFRNEAQFRGWYANFASVRTLPASEIGNYTPAGSVLAKPGTRLVKSVTGPRVYVVGADGQLHWVTSGEVLVARYGKQWGKHLDILLAAQFADYRVAGDTVATEAQFLAAVNGTN